MITLEKAIEISEAYVKGQIHCFIEELDESVQLGAEAMKRLQDMRISPCTTADETLLGETKE